MHLLMCPPTYFGVEYEINPWMRIENQANRDLAIQQWKTLYDTLEKLKIEISLILSQPGLPDMCFAANAAVVFEKRALMAKFKYKERQGEEQYYNQWFKDHGYDLIHVPPHYSFEGAGDALWSGKTMFVGHGFRSDLGAANRITYELLGCTSFRNEGSRVCNMLDDMIALKLVDPYFYHLDTCFCPLNDNEALIWPGAFDQDSYNTLKKNLNLIEVPEQDARKFACNAVVKGEAVVLPKGCEKTCQLLQDREYETHEVDMSQFILAGGAVRCLCLVLE